LEPSNNKWSLYVKGKDLCETSNKDAKKCVHDAVENIELLYFVMAAQASCIIFSFYYALDTSSKKNWSCMNSNKVVFCFFQNEGEMKVERTARQS